MLEHKKDSTKFYGEDLSDLEKVVVCSVISSGRPDNNISNNNISNIGGDDSLSNTQKYVPLRTKN